MLKKRNLLFLSLLILGVLLLSSCFLNPPATEGILKGQIMVPEGTVQAKDLTGQALPDATINIIDLSTGAIIATTTTDSNGNYQVSVPSGGPYLLEAAKDGVKVQQVTPQVETGIEYDLGTADATTTAVALIMQAMMDAGTDLADINLADIEAGPDFNDVVSSVTGIIEAGGDPTTSAAIEEAVEDFLNPPAPIPTPASTPSYTVTFDKNDIDAVGTMAAQTITSGSTANLTTCGFTKAGWSFAGWATTSGGTVVYADGVSYTMGSANVTFYAKWIINTYTVTYDGNGSTGGTVPTDSTAYKENDAVNVLDKGDMVKTQDGITLLFTGWNTAVDGSGNGGINYSATDNFNMGSSNISLYAQWSVLRGTGPAGGLIFYDKGSVSDGWRYLEAALSDQSTGIQWYNGTYITTDATGTVLGTGPVNTTKIIDSQGETTTAYAAGLARAYHGGSYNDWFLPSKDELNQMYANLHNISTPVGDFDAEAYWSSTESEANRAWFVNFFGGQFDDPKDLTLHVRAARAFRSTAPTYIVNYNANGATGGAVPSDPYHYQEAESVTVLVNTGSLIKDDHIFSGWNTEAGGTGTDQAESSTFNMGNDNVTLFAKWTPTYTVTFDKNDVGATETMAPQIFASGSSANLTACAFTKTGWTFAGWATTSGGTVAYADEASYTMGTSNVTLYAKWTANNYDITFNANGGSGSMSVQTIASGSSANLTACAFTKTGWTFAGWATTSDGTVSYTNEASYTMGTADVILYAQWTANNYTVTFDINDAFATGAMTPQSIASGSSANLTACAFTKTGWTFAGWATTSDGTVAYVDEANYTMGTFNVTLYAKWTIILITGPAGGKVFYDKGSYSDGWRYLEAAPSNQSTLQVWSNVNYEPVGTSAQGTAIGTGQANTTAIIAQVDHYTSAAKLCDDLEIINITTYDDWFLPSKDELALMYTNGIVGGSGDYWSSSEYAEYDGNYADDTAWSQDGSGGWWGRTKDYTASVRAIRAY